MPSPTRRRQTKTLSDGSTRTYESWCGSWTTPQGERRQVALGNCEVVPEALARKRLSELMQADHKPTARAISLSEWCDEYIARLEGHRDRSTIGDYRQVQRLMVDCWGDIKLRAVNAQHVQRLLSTIRGTKVSEATVMRHYVVGKAIFEAATKEPDRRRPYITLNPFADVEKPDGAGAAEFVYVSPADAAKVLACQKNNNWRALFALTRLCALRMEEALALSPADIDWDKHTLIVRLRENRKGKGKGTKQGVRIVPMSPAAYTIVLARFGELEPGCPSLIDRKPLEAGQTHPQDKMRAWLERAGVLNVVKPFHDLRKSQAHDWSMLHGCEHSAKWCGHSIEVAIKHYRRLSSESVGLVTGTADPKAELAKAYVALDAGAGNTVGISPKA